MASRLNRSFRRSKTSTVGGVPFAATWTVSSTGPIVMGLPSPPGGVPAGTGIQVGAFTTQTTFLNTWSDGSMRHGAISYNATSTGAKGLSVITNPGGSTTPTWPTASISFAITIGPGAGSTYTATLPAFDGTHTVTNGAVCRRSWVRVTPTTAGAVAHANLRVKFEVTSYVAGGHTVSYAYENIRNVSTMDQVTATVSALLNGSTVSALAYTGIIYTGQRWHRKAVTGTTEAVVLHDFEPWINANVIPRISPTIDATPRTISGAVLTYDTTTPQYGLGGGIPPGDLGGRWFFGEAEGYMFDSENADRQEINPWCDHEARLFVFKTEALRLVALANGNQSGGWTWQISRTSDDEAILKLTEDSNDTGTWCDRVGGILGSSGLAWPADPVPYHSSWRGAADGPNAPDGSMYCDPEHPNDMVFVPYLLTCDTFYLDQLRYQGAWTALSHQPDYSEPNPSFWPNYFRGRHGTLGEFAHIGFNRGFGRPFKKVARAAWAMPDSYAADQTYLKTVTSNNLDAVAYYVDYLTSKGWNGGSWGHIIGFDPVTYHRDNTVSSTTGASPTVLTVVGDASGVGVGTNDHGMQTGDYVTLAGFSGGAIGLNGYRAITRLSATTFSVAVNTTGSATTAVGTWSAYTGANSGYVWQLCDAAREVSWACFTGLWTITPSMWAMTDRAAQWAIALQDQPNFDTTPGLSYHYAPSCATVVGSTYVFPESYAAYKELNDPQSSTAKLLLSEATYTSYGSSNHRGTPIGWNPTSDNRFYTPYALVLIANGTRRGISGAGTAYTRLLAATDVLPEVKRRPGFFHEASSMTAVSPKYVSTSGSDTTGTGTSANPWQTFGHAAPLLVAGDLLYLRGGNFFEDVEVGSSCANGTSFANAITVKGYPGETAVINKINVNGARRYWIFQDLSCIKDAPDIVGVGVGGGEPDGTGAGFIRFVNITVSGYTGGASSGGGGVQFSVGSIGSNEFIGGRVHNISWPAPAARPAPHGFYISCANNLVQGVEIDHVAQYAIHNFSGNPNGNRYLGNHIHDCGTSGYTSGAMLLSGDNNLATNNIIEHNANGILFYDFGGSPTGNHVYNNSLYRNGNGRVDPGINNYPAIYIGVSQVTAAAKNNLIFGNLTSTVDDHGTGSVISTNSSADPSYVDAAAANFHLQVGSGAINAGTTLTEVPTDKDDVIRPQGAAYDIGAYER